MQTSQTVDQLYSDTPLLSVPFSKFISELITLISMDDSIFVTIVAWSTVLGEYAFKLIANDFFPIFFAFFIS